MRIVTFEIHITYDETVINANLIEAVLDDVLERSTQIETYLDEGMKSYSGFIRTSDEEAE